MTAEMELEDGRATADVASWRVTAKRADAWREELSASEFVVRAIRFGIRDMPKIPFEAGFVMSRIPQSEEDEEFAEEELRERVRRREVEEIGEEEAMRIVAEGKIVSSAFVVWQGEGGARKGRFVINLSIQSKHWPRGSVKMETVQGFAAQVERGDSLMSFDVQGGYRHFFLHPDMRDMFLFRYGGRFYRCIALPFGWGRSGLWFTKLMRPLVQRLREKEQYRVLAYLDDFLVAPSRVGRVSSAQDCERARRVIGQLLGRLGITRHPDKGEWEGSTRLEHLGVLIDTVEMRVFVTDAKVVRVQKWARKVIGIAARNQRLVPLDMLRSFCGLCVSLTLAMPLARFYTRSLYFDMARAERESMGKEKDVEGPNTSAARVRICRQSMRDLSFWRKLTRGEGRDLVPVGVDVTMHSDEADVGYGGTLGFDEGAGSPGFWEGRGFWEASDRRASITLRELRAVRLLLHRHFYGYVSDPRVRRILLHEDNQAVVCVLNAMVSASKEMMAELRKLDALMKAMGVRIEARWLPSAVNKFADALSRTWDPGDARATSKIVESVQKEYGLDGVAFRDRPLGETMVARRKYLSVQMAEHWGDGLARIYNPPFDMLPLVVRKLEQEGGTGVVLAPKWPAQPWYARLVALSSKVRVLGAEADGKRIWDGARNVNERW